MDGADGVYPSSEDSFLLIDAVHKDIQFIKDNVSIFPLCIEIGYVPILRNNCLDYVASFGVSDHIILTKSRNTGIMPYNTSADVGRVK